MIYLLYIYSLAVSSLGESLAMYYSHLLLQLLFPFCLKYDMENEVLDINSINQEQYVNCFKSELMARERSAEAPSQHRQVTHATGQIGYLPQETWSSPLYLLDMLTSSQALGITGFFKLLGSFLILAAH